jgi:oligopeptide/dipeptide ABC transporter ATP-binding protein
MPERPDIDAAAPVLDVSGLVVDFALPHRRPVRLVDDVSFSIARGETYGLVGQSGSGKSLTAQALMGLLRRTPGMSVAGSIRLDGRELVGQSARRLSKVNGNAMSMVFQDATSSLDPAFTVGEQIAESLRRHRGLSRRAAWQEALENLRLVEIPAAERRMKSYPHEFSGGMRQRVMVAIAVACRPQVLIADEATTALDVTVQAQVLGLLRRLQQELGMSLLFITHDLSVLADIADRVGVMYAGQLVEESSVFDIFEGTSHPYSAELLRSSPEFLALSGSVRAVGAQQVASSGCRFRPRCEFAKPQCEEPIPLEIVPGPSAHQVRCVRAGEIMLPTADDLWRQLYGDASGAGVGSTRA